MGRLFFVTFSGGSSGDTNSTYNLYGIYFNTTSRTVEHIVQSTVFWALCFQILTITELTSYFCSIMSLQWIHSASLQRFTVHAYYYSPETYLKGMWQAIFPSLLDLYGKLRMSSGFQIFQGFLWYYCIYVYYRFAERIMRESLRNANVIWHIFVYHCYCRWSRYYWTICKEKLLFHPLSIRTCVNVQVACLITSTTCFSQ